MHTTSLYRVDSGDRLVSCLQIADTHWLRLRGLLGRAGLNQEEAMLFSPGGGIHTLGMQFTIDVVFLNVHRRVLAVAAKVVPQRLKFAPAGTRYTLELAAGMTAQHQLQPGQTLEWQL